MGGIHRSFSVVILLLILLGCFAVAATAAPAPQAASKVPGISSATAKQEGRTIVFRRAATKPRPQQAQPPVLLPPVWYTDGPEIPKQIVGQTSTPFPMIITNSSTTATVIVSSVTGDNPEFVFGGNCVSTGGIAPGGTCTLEMTYNPTSVCENSVVDITFTDDDPGGNLVLSLESFGAGPGGIVTDDLRDTSLTATQVAQSLVGPGVTISNVTYTGSPWALGTFTGGTGILGFGTGIILSNGAVSNVIGPNCSSSITQSNATPGDTDLSNLIGQVTNDAAVLEFDFVPTSPTISFQYVFASDEYQEFVFDFNDVFGFFLGAEGNRQDIALIPGTNTIVSINNVNNGSTDPANLSIPPVNPQFYVNNDFQFTEANIAPFNTEMDGLTVVLTAKAQVTPGQTSHIKLAVADAIDTVFDSNVFIRAGSLTSSVVSFSPPTLAFGNEGLGATSAAQTVTITNLGTTALTPFSIGTSSTNFAQTNTCGASLAAGASCTASVTFVPQAAGLQQGNLTITDNAPDSPQLISISGTAISGAYLTYSPYSLTIGTAGAAQTITLTNTGTSGLTIASIVAGGDFTETNTCPESAIPPNGTCTVSVTWTPPANPLIPDSGTLTITDNAQNQGTQTIGLTGGVTLTVGISPETLAFGNQAVNTTSAAQTITLTNTGTVPLNVPSVVVSSNFAETNTCTAAAIAVGGTCTINVMFSPTAATTYAGTVTIADNAPGSPQVVMLTGTGTSAAGPTLTIAPTSLTFASQAVGTTSAPQTVMVSNTGTTLITFTAIETSGDFSGATLAQCPSLAGGASCSFAIVFTPTATGARTGAIAFTDNATGSPQMVALAGTGVAKTSTVTVAPPNLTFGPQPLNTTSPALPVTVTNTGNSVVDFTSFTATGDFAVTNAGTCSTDGGIGVGGSCTVTVAFTPTATGARAGTLAIADSATGSPQMVALTGTGGTGNITLTVTEAGTGSGTVTSAPAGINCPTTCAAGFASGTSVTLTATPATGSTFAGWGAPCSGTGTCVVTLTAATTVTATFNLSNQSVVITVPSGGSTSATTTPGGTAFYGLLITGAPGTSGTVTLTCASSSPFVTCKVVPSTVVLSGTSTTEVAFGIQTYCTGPTNTGAGFVPAAFGGFGGGVALLLMGMLGVVTIGFKRDRRLAMTFAMLLVMAFGSAACSSLATNPNGATPAGTYTISLTTTLNGSSQTLPNFLTLIVK
jgi:hypothetical protein